MKICQHKDISPAQHLKIPLLDAYLYMPKASPSKPQSLEGIAVKIVQKSVRYSDCSFAPTSSSRSPFWNLMERPSRIACGSFSITAKSSSKPTAVKTDPSICRLGSIRNRQCLTVYQPTVNVKYQNICSKECVIHHPLSPH